MVPSEFTAVFSPIFNPSFSIWDKAVTHFPSHNSPSASPEIPQEVGQITDKSLRSTARLSHLATLASDTAADRKALRQILQAAVLQFSSVLIFQPVRFLLQGRPIQVKRKTTTYIRLITQESSDSVLGAKVVVQKVESACQGTVSPGWRKHCEEGTPGEQGLEKSHVPFPCPQGKVGAQELWIATTHCAHYTCGCSILKPFQDFSGNGISLT